MTTHGIDRLRRSLDNQRAYGVESYELAMEDMERLVREVEDERDRKDACADGWAARCAELLQGPLAFDRKPLRIGETVWGQDGKQFTVDGVGPEFVWGRAEGKKTHNRLRPEWLTHERPDSWAAIERDATTSPASYCHVRGIDRDVEWQDMSEGIEAMALDLVARCKKLAGVE